MKTTTGYKVLLTTIAAPAIYFLVGLTSVSEAAEYRIIIGDSAACSSAGASGSDCLIKVSGGTTTVSSSTTSSSSSSASSSDCVVTTWNRCSNSGGTTSGTGGVISSNTSSTPTTTTTTTTTSSSAPPPPSTTVSGSKDYGSGGSDSTGRTELIEITGNISALPFTTIVGGYAGKVSVVETSGATPTDGSGVRAWISTSRGGAPLSAACSKNFGFEGSLHWDQKGEISYACQIPNQANTLYLNLQLCISGRTDKTCSASGARASNETARLYIYATNRRS